MPSSRTTLTSPFRFGLPIQGRGTSSGSILEFMSKLTLSIDMNCHCHCHCSRYPFTYTLPVDLPQTLEDSRYATLNYNIKGTVVMTQGRVSSSMDETFFLKALPDPIVPKPAEEDLPKVWIWTDIVIDSCQ